MGLNFVFLLPFLPQAMILPSYEGTKVACLYESIILSKVLSSTFVPSYFRTFVLSYFRTFESTFVLSNFRTFESTKVQV